MRRLLALLVVTAPRHALAMQPCPPGTEPSMIGPAVVGLVVVLGVGLGILRARAARDRRARVRWTLLTVAFALIGLAADLAYAMFQHATGACV
jgi:hypothetical protein